MVVSRNLPRSRSLTPINQGERHDFDHPQRACCRFARYPDHRDGPDRDENARARPRPIPGQSEWAPGQRAKGPGVAKDFAPGQRMHKKDVKSQPGASEYAPGHLPNKDVKR